MSAVGIRRVNVSALAYLFLLGATFLISSSTDSHAIRVVAGTACTVLLVAAIPVALFLVGWALVFRRETIGRASEHPPAEGSGLVAPLALLVVSLAAVAFLILVGLFFSIE